MPLHDLFQQADAHWQLWSSFFRMWTVLLVQELNQKLLPERYQALPHFQRGARVLAEMIILHPEAGHSESDTANEVEATGWPPRPSEVVPTDLANQDVFEVRVYDHEQAMQVVAAIEPVSPANKDCPDHLRAFAARCAAYLQLGIGVVVIDVVTERRKNLHGELMDLLDLG